MNRVPCIAVRIMALGLCSRYALSFSYLLVRTVPLWGFILLMLCSSSRTCRPIIYRFPANKAILTLCLQSDAFSTAMVLSEVTTVYKNGWELWRLVASSQCPTASPIGFLVWQIDLRSDIALNALNDRQPSSLSMPTSILSSGSYAVLPLDLQANGKSAALSWHDLSTGPRHTPTWTSTCRGESNLFSVVRVIQLILSS
jgi:hypothetical protein